MDVARASDTWVNGAIVSNEELRGNRCSCRAAGPTEHVGVPGFAAETSGKGAGRGWGWGGPCRASGASRFGSRDSRFGRARCRFRQGRATFPARASNVPGRGEQRSRQGRATVPGRGEQRSTPRGCPRHRALRHRGCATARPPVVPNRQEAVPTSHGQVWDRDFGEVRDAVLEGRWTPYAGRCGANAAEVPLEAVPTRVFAPRAATGGPESRRYLSGVTHCRI